MTSPSALRMMSLGDSQSAGSATDAYRAEMSRLLAAVGVAVDWRVAAVSGTRTTYWSPKIKQLLIDHDPDLVVVILGTNDDTATAAARDQMATSVRIIAETIRTHRGEVTPVRQIGAYIQLSDPYNPLTPSWLPASEERANTVLRTEYARYLPYWTSLAVADLSRIPGNPLTVADGMHPSPYGRRVCARLLYDAGAARGWWPPCGEPAPTDLYGHAMGTPVPGFVPSVA